MTRPKAIVASALVALAAVGGCTRVGTPVSEGPDEHAAAATSTTRTPRVVDNSDRPLVMFDPCLDIPDDVLVELGYNPRTEESADYPMGDYTFLGCRYRSTFNIPGELRAYGLGVLSGNVSLDEERAKEAAIATETTVNGRPALLKYDPTAAKQCAITVQAAYGIVIFSRVYHPDHTRPLTFEQRCGGLADTAAAIEPYIAGAEKGGAN